MPVDGPELRIADGPELRKFGGCQWMAPNYCCKICGETRSHRISRSPEPPGKPPFALRRDGPQKRPLTRQLQADLTHDLVEFRTKRTTPPAVARFPDDTSGHHQYLPRRFHAGQRGQSRSSGRDVDYDSDRPGSGYAPGQFGFGVSGEYDPYGRRASHCKRERREADVVNRIGWPGLVDTYRVDFKMPGAAGDAHVQLTVAWVNGPAMTIPAR